MKMILPLLVAAVLVGTGVARPEFQMQIPNGLAGSDPSSGISCSPLGHEECVAGAARNEFGLAFQAAGFKWTKELCEADSDGDGESNGSELGDPCCLWTPNNTNPKGFRVTNLSHPGDASDDGSKAAPKCEESSDTADSTEAPAVVTEAPVETTEVPAVVTESPVQTTEAPAAAIEAPAETATSAPAVVTEAQVKTTTPAPAVVTEAPVDKATMAPMVVTDAPVLVTTKMMQTAAEAEICSQTNAPCSSDCDCCKSTDKCTDAPWEGTTIRSACRGHMLLACWPAASE